MSTNLSDEQKKRIEENRQKNLARLKRNRTSKDDQNGSPNLLKRKITKTFETTDKTSPKRSINQVITPEETSYKSKFIQFNEDNSIKRSKTQEERNKVEQNRLRAIEIQQNKLREKEKQSSTATASAASSNIYNDPNVKPQQTTSLEDIRLNKNHSDFIFDSKKGKFQPPPIKKKDYIEFDFATMQDSKGGFINDETKPRHDEETLNEWKEKQKKLEQLKQSAPPLDINQAPKCYECESLDIDLNLFTNFNKVRACRKCIKSKPEKYSLLVKTECKEDYLLTEPELQDLSILPRIEKPNPHGYSKMQLFLRFQVEEFAFKKWGSSEGLDLEWERREQNKLKRKEKKYQESLQEMRKKTRAEEFTRKLRDGKSLNYKHLHDWSAPLKIDDHTIKKRCIDCGIEIEEVII